MCMIFVFFLCCFCSLFCYVTRHADIVIRITQFSIVYIRVTSPTVTSRVNEAIVNYQKNISTLSFMRYHGWYKRYYFFFENLIGTENDLNHVLSSFVDSEHEIVNFYDSRYIDMSDIKSVSRRVSVISIYFHSTCKVLMINLITYFRLLTICLPPAYNLARFVCRKRGWVQMLTFPCFIYRVINWSIKVFVLLNMEDSLYILMKNIRINCEIYMTSRMCGKLFSLMLMDIT